MKIVRIPLNEAEMKELKKLQRGTGYLSERANAVLLCSEGRKLNWISDTMHRSMNTIRSWIHGYIKHGIKGLERDYSPGRPKNLRETLANHITEYFLKSPSDYGWGEEVWTEKVIVAQFQRETGISLGESTVYRCLRDMGYSYKRAKKTVPSQAPSKAEKLKRVKEIAKEILALECTDDAEIYFQDESHFSTDPYVTRGWHPKGVPFFPTDAQNAQVNHNLWCIRSKGRYILLDECTYGECK